MRRHSAAMMAAAVTVILGLVGNLATANIQVPARWKPWAWAVTALLAVTAVGFEMYRNRIDRQASPASDDRLATAAEQLAQAVRDQWQDAEKQRMVNDPYPLPVRWIRHDEGLFDHWSNICRAGPGEEPDLPEGTGGLPDVVSAYRRLPSRRLVILGQAGAGKTVLAGRFILDWLRTRAGADAVPVMIGLGGWNPTATTLRDLIIDQLGRDHPGLSASGGDGASLAAALVDSGAILPVLDGFDEIAEGRHQAAFDQLNEDNTRAFILTSRVGQYAAARGRAGVLKATAGIRLTELTVDDIATYLPRTSGPTVDAEGLTRSRWDATLAVLRTRPRDSAARNLTTVLATPLMVYLARVAYGGEASRDATDLLDTTRFPTTKEIEEHLLAEFVPALYRSPGPAERNPRPGLPADRRHREWQTEHAHRWLGYLAWHLNRLDTRDLAWWQLADSIPRLTRGLVAGLVVGLAIGVSYGPDVGLAFALAFGCAPLRAGSPSRGRLPSVLKALAIGVPTGAVSGLVVGYAYALQSSFANDIQLAATLRSSLRMGLIAGVLYGLLFGVAYWFAGGTSPSPARPPHVNLARRTKSSLLLGLAVGGAFWVTTAVVPGLIRGNPADEGALANFLVFAVAGALAGELIGELAPSRTRLRVRGRVARIVKSLAIGLVVGLVIPAAYGLAGLFYGFSFVYVLQMVFWLPVGIVFGLAVGLAAPVDVRSTTSPTDLLLTDRTKTVFQSLLVGLAVGLADWAAFGPAWALVDWLVFALAYGIVFNAWGRWVIVARIWLPLTGRSPWPVVAFIDDAYRRGVLRQAGAVWQFRHARLQDHLAQAYQSDAAFRASCEKVTRRR